MEDRSFDRLTRRLVLGGFTTALGLGMARVPDAATAGNRRKRKKRKKVKRNQFGCVNVGDFCKNAGQCCSGICQGKKGKKTCRNHDAGTGCEAGDREPLCGGESVVCATATDAGGVCDTTTGNAPYCRGSQACAGCRKDAECREICGPTAACIKCPDCEGFETACVGSSPGDCL